VAVVPRQPRFEIAAMRLTDLDHVMDIERQSFRTPWSRQVFVEELDREWAHVDVLRPRSAGTVLGFVNYWLVRDEVHILNVAAHASHRRRGVATQLLAHVIGFARRQHCRYATLEVRRSNEAAIRLYGKFGFKPVGVRPHYYAEDNEDAIVMLLELD
jgi:ribosomal-protein-alanine N-acetyltransferase